MLKLSAHTRFLLILLFSFGWSALAVLPGIAQTDSSQGVLELVPDTAPLPLDGELVPLGSEPIQTSPQATQETEEAIAPGFTFTNTLEYGDCLEVILRLYENAGGLRPREQQSQCYREIQQRFGTEGLSRSEALRLVSATNFYATTMLATDLYPPRGQRIRVAALFGFIYSIDTNDSQIRELATQAQQ